MGTIARTPLSDEVYRQVLQRIQRGDLPAGRRVKDVDLAAQLGVSRTPVREALLRLSRDGALENSVGRGFRVRPLDPGELRETGAILGALEALALRLSPEPTPERVERLVALDQSLEHTRGDAARCLDLEDEWHRVLLEACPNRRLLDLITSLRQVTRRYLAAYMRDAGRLSLSTLPHVRILQAFRDAGRDSAATAFEQQWRRGVAELEAWVRKAPDGGSAS
ncbi:MAG TPA: GntR family transcriptional regulator [Gemmatimonadales bacterium]|nr:GntR family transcriptional regulator [Gemmatimonadales bacterium]